MTPEERAIVAVVIAYNAVAPRPPVPREEAAHLHALSVYGARSVPFTCRRCGTTQPVFDAAWLRRPLEGTCGTCVLLEAPA